MKKALAALMLASLALNLAPQVVSAQPGKCDDESVAAVASCPPRRTTTGEDHGNTRRLDATCPSPTTPRGSQCVLTDDVQLSQALELASGTKLNCEGHRLTPSPAKPEVGVVIAQASGVRLQNCVIDGFLFGVVVLDAKVPAKMRSDPDEVEKVRTKILDNRIRAAEGIIAYKADALEIRGNEITLLSNGGDGIRLNRDSDFNRVIGNHITSAASGPGLGYLAPGQLDPVECVCASGVFVSNGLGLTDPEGSTINVRVGSIALQFPWEPQNVPEDNVIEGNRIEFAAEFVNTGILFGDSTRRPVVRGNRIVGAWFGILAGGNFTDTVDARSSDATIEENVIVGPGRDGMQVGLTHNAKVRRNLISGAGRAAITLYDAGLATATLSRNTLSGNSFGLNFASFGETRIGATVSLNDITGSLVRAIRTSGPAFTATSELSSAGRGNYWGHTCAEGGFLSSDSPTPLIIDSHPFGVPVASGDRDELPMPCR